MSLIRGRGSTVDHVILPTRYDMAELQASVAIFAGNDNIARRVVLRVILAALRDEVCMRTFIECLAEHNKDILRHALAESGLVLWDKVSEKKLSF